MATWDQVKGEKDELWAKVLEGLSEVERKILVDLIQLEVENRSYSVPKVKAPLRKKVEGYLP